MSVFRPFEIKVLHLLVAPKLGASTVDTIVHEAEFVEYDYTGAGYFLTVRHSSLPTEYDVRGELEVVGRYEKIEVYLSVFIENGQLILECYSDSEEDVPEDVRDKNVIIAEAKLPD